MLTATTGILTVSVCSLPFGIFKVTSSERKFADYDIRPLLTLIFEPVHEISNNVVCKTSKASDQPAHTRSLIGALQVA